MTCLKSVIKLITGYSATVYCIPHTLFFRGSCGALCFRFGLGLRFFSSLRLATGLGLLATALLWQKWPARTQLNMNLGQKSSQFFHKYECDEMAIVGLNIFLALHVTESSQGNYPGCLERSSSPSASMALGKISRSNKWYPFLNMSFGRCGSCCVQLPQLWFLPRVHWPNFY